MRLSSSSSSPLLFLSSLLVVLSPVLLLLLLSPLTSAQSLTNVTGTANCQFSTFELNTSNTAYISMSGNLTVNLTAASYKVPNTPGFSTATFLSYPIVSMTGLRELFTLGADFTPSMTYFNITGIGANRTIYLTFDPTQDASGFPGDPGYAYRFDSTGITILTNSTTQPAVQFYEASTTAGDGSPYTEKGLNYPAAWAGASLSLGPCTQTFAFVAPTAVAAVSSSTAAAGPAGGARGDPSFTGFRGQLYQVHGMADTVYNVITDRHLQLNALFVFLTQGSCPVVEGVTLSNCWSHPGSYFGALALRTTSGHRLLINAGAASQGLTLTIDDAPLTSSTTAPDLSVTVVNSHRVVVQAGVYRLTVENSDGFLNLVQAQVLDWQALKRDVQSHGLLGQTWQSRGAQAIEGAVDDYAEGDNDLFGSHFLYNKFQLSPAA